MKFTSYSQAAQDAVVNALIPEPSTFIDCGCGAAISISNTYGLEQIGWRGLLVDNSREAYDDCVATRKSRCIHDDATKIDWWRELSAYPPTAGGFQIGYLSLDIDEASADALNEILNAALRFRVLTVEDDSYRHGDRLREPMRALLTKFGYDIFASDVCSDDGLPYEMWACEPALSRAADRFRSSNMKWRDILRQGGIEA
jgi:hypothetical protein